MKTKWRLIAILFILGWISTLQSQNKILKGRVVEGGLNEPVIGALVYNTTFKQLAITDFYGQFELEVTESIPTQLYIKYTGFNPVFSDINPGSDSILIKLPSTPYSGIVIVEIGTNNMGYSPKTDSLRLLYLKYDSEIDSIYRSTQISQILPEDIYFLNLNNKAFKWRQSNDTLYEYKCSPTGECLTDIRRHYRIHSSAFIPPFAVLKVERLDTIQLTTKPYPLDRFHIFVLLNPTEEQVGFACVGWALTKEQLDTTHIEVDSFHAKFFYTYFSETFLNEIHSYKKVTTKRDVNRIVRVMQGKELQNIIDRYQNTQIGDIYGSILLSELLNKACLQLGFNPVGANDVINDVKAKL